jgi:hypothetical protein
MTDANLISTILKGSQNQKKKKMKEKRKRKRKRKRRRRGNISALTYNMLLKEMSSMTPPLNRFDLNLIPLSVPKKTQFSTLTLRILKGTLDSLRQI